MTKTLALFGLGAAERSMPIRKHADALSSVSVKRPHLILSYQLPVFKWDMREPRLKRVQMSLSWRFALVLNWWSRVI